jgi:hypothetical protein
VLLELHVPGMTQNKVLRPNTQNAMQHKKNTRKGKKQKQVMN